MLDSNYQGIKRLFVLAYNNTDGDRNCVNADSLKKYFLPRVKIEKYNFQIDGRNFYDHSINYSIKQYAKVSLLIPAYLNKQKALDADSRAIQQIFFTAKLNTAAIIYRILEQSKETILQFSTQTTKVLQLHING